MRSRRFRKRIEVYEYSTVADGYGGNTISESLLATLWADIRSVNKKTDLSQYGISGKALVLDVTIRKQTTFNLSSVSHFIKYNSEAYTIASFPTNDNFDNRLINFFAVKQES